MVHFVVYFKNKVQVFIVCCMQWYRSEAEKIVRKGNISPKQSRGQMRNFEDNCFSRGSAVITPYNIYYGSTFNSTIIFHHKHTTTKAVVKVTNASARDVT